MGEKLIAGPDYMLHLPLYNELSLMFYGIRVTFPNFSTGPRHKPTSCLQFAHEQLYTQ